MGLLVEHFLGWPQLEMDQIWERQSRFRPVFQSCFPLPFSSQPNRAFPRIVGICAVQCQQRPLTLPCLLEPGSPKCLVTWPTFCLVPSPRSMICINCKVLRNLEIFCVPKITVSYGDLLLVFFLFLGCDTMLLWTGLSAFWRTQLFFLITPNWQDHCQSADQKTETTDLPEEQQTIPFHPVPSPSSPSQS